jgi:hypothetical protein
MGNLRYLIYLSLLTTLFLGAIVYFYFQESLSFLLLLSPSLSSLVYLLFLKGGFGPFFLWVFIIVEHLKGLPLLHFLRRLKLPYYPLFLSREAPLRPLALSGALLAGALLLLVGRPKGVLVLRRAESSNIILLGESRPTGARMLAGAYTALFLELGAPNNTPEERLEEALTFLSLPLTFGLRIKIIIFSNTIPNLPLLRVMVFSLWARATGATLFLLQGALRTPTKRGVWVLRKFLLLAALSLLS